MLVYACGDDGPTDPGGGGDTPPYTLEVVEPAPAGFAGQVVPTPVRVRLLDPDGLPAAGRFLTFSPSAGGRVLPSAAATDVEGIASVTWRLAAGSGPQSLRVGSSLLGAPVELAADILPFADVDAVVLEGIEAGDAVGALVDGSVSLGEVDDFRFVGSGPTLGLGDWRGDGTAGELMVFVPGGPFFHAARPGFTASPDTLRLEEADRTPIDLTVWMVTPVAEQSRIEGALVVAERIFEEEGLGVTIRSVEFRDAEVSGDVLSFRCPLRSLLETEAGREEGRINVYVVFSVDGSDSRGQACEIGGSFVALAHQAGPTLLAHELGHNLSLIHVDSNTEHFDRRNVMHSASDTRVDLTEGQVVRAQLNQASVLNALLGSRTPDVQRNCYGGMSTSCPPTELRLFADSGFGPWPSAGGAAATDAEALLVTCGLGEPSSPAGMPIPEPGLDPARLEAMLAEGPAPELVERWKSAARARARANARWLAELESPPAWLGGVRPAAAFDEEAAANDAATRLQGMWSERMEELTGRR